MENFLLDRRIIRSQFIQMTNKSVSSSSKDLESTFPSHIENSLNTPESGMVLQPSKKRPRVDNVDDRK